MAIVDRPVTDRRERVNANARRGGMRGMGMRGMRSAARQVGGVTAKLLVGIFILVCLALGVVGLLLPIIPGLLFLAIAALLAARYSPALERLLRKSRTIGRYLDGANRFSTLSFGHKLQVGALLCLKVLVDVADWAVTAAGKVVGLAAAGVRRYGGRRTT